MDFQPWRDYFQLASLVQKMACMDIGKPQPAKPFLINPTEATEDQGNGEDPTIYDSLTCPIPFKDERPADFEPPDFYYQVGLSSSHNWNCNEHLGYNRYQPKTPDNNFKTEPEAHYKSSKSHPAISSTKREARSRNNMCHFCKHNGESRHVYTGHNLKDEWGKIICPILRMYTCSLCGATGDSSHTRKYCPINKNKDKLQRKTERNSAGHRMRH